MYARVLWKLWRKRESANTVEWKWGYA